MYVCVRDWYREVQIVISLSGIFTVQICNFSKTSNISPVFVCMGVVYVCRHECVCVGACMRMCISIFSSINISLCDRHIERCHVM